MKPRLNSQNIHKHIMGDKQKALERQRIVHFIIQRRAKLKCTLTLDVQIIKSRLVIYQIYLKQVLKSSLLPLIFKAQSERSLPPPFISWTCVRFSHICDFSLTGAACPIPGKHRWIPDGKVLPNRPALHPARIPRYSQSLSHSLLLPLSPLPLPPSVTRARCQLMSLSTHLLVAPGQSDINLLNSCNLFMVENNGKNIVQNLSI